MDARRVVAHNETHLANAVVLFPPKYLKRTPVGNLELHLDLLLAQCEFPPVFYCQCDKPCREMKGSLDRVPGNPAFQRGGPNPVCVAHHHPSRQVCSPHHEELRSSATRYTASVFFLCLCKTHCMLPQLRESLLCERADCS